MANTETVSNRKLIAKLDTPGATSPITVKGACLIDLAIDLTAGDTIQLQAEYATGAANALQWQTVESYTTDTVKVVRIASARRVRINKSVDAGDAFIELAVGNKE
jgi:hypothetical protein